MLRALPLGTCSARIFRPLATTMRAASSKSPEEWPVAWVAALNACDIAAMDALTKPPFTFVVQGRKFELDSMGSLINFDKLKGVGWRKTTVKDVAVLHGDG